MIRVQRIAEFEKWQDMYIDIYAPQKLKYDSIGVNFWNAGGKATIHVDDLKIMRALK